MIQQKNSFNKPRITFWSEISDITPPSNKSIWRKFSRRKALPQKNNSLDRQNKELWDEFQDIQAFWEAFWHLRQQAIARQKNNTPLIEVPINRCCPPQKKEDFQKKSNTCLPQPPDISTRSSFTYKAYWKGIATILVVALLLFAGINQLLISHKQEQVTTPQTIDISKGNFKTWQGYKTNQDFRSSGALLSLNRTIWSKAHNNDTSIVMALPEAKIKQVQDSIPSHYISHQYLLQALAQSTQRPCNLNRHNQSIYKLFAPNDTSIYFIEVKEKVLHRVLQLNNKFYKIRKSGRLDNINTAQHQVYKAYFTLDTYWLDKPIGKVQGLQAILYQSNKGQKKFYITPSQWKDKHFHIQIKPIPLFTMVQ